MRASAAFGAWIRPAQRATWGALLAALAGLATISVSGCGDSGEPSRPAAPSEAVEIGGPYHVTGVTIGDTTGMQRPIQGRIKLVVKGDTYTTHFELQTLYPGSKKVSAQVIGTGEGVVKGNVLEGDAHLQIVATKVPGVDVGFAFVPRGVGPRVVSTSNAEFFGDGSVRIELRNEPAEGADYEPTRTHLVGYRVEDQ